MGVLTAPKNPHAWIRPPHLPTEHRGFLVEWVQMDDGWRARVLYLHPRTGEQVWVEVPADRVAASGFAAVHGIGLRLKKPKAPPSSGDGEESGAVPR